MDAIAEFQKLLLPLRDYLLSNTDALWLVVVIGSIVLVPLAEDNWRRPRALYDSLFAKGTSSGRGDIPGGEE